MVSFDLQKEEAEGLVEITLDVLKPRELSMIDIANKLSELEGITKIEVASKEVEIEAEKILINIVGNKLNFQRIMESIEDMGVAVHGIEKVLYKKRGSS